MSKRKQKIYPKVLLKDPHIQSLAALILLHRKYGNLIRQYRPEWRIWLSFRNKYLKRQARGGPLECHYCGLSPLYKNSRITPNLQRATIDHVHPRSKGGKEYDEANLVVCCAKCNQKKGDKLLKDHSRSGRDLSGG